MAIDRLIARREVHLREKTLWRMLYETAARAEEVLGVNIEELDLAGRRCQVKAKGAQPKAQWRSLAMRRGAIPGSGVDGVAPELGACPRACGDWGGAVRRHRIPQRAAAPAVWNRVSPCVGGSSDGPSVLHQKLK
jgi:hypothetical protein